jgi:hypothetical protein
MERTDVVRILKRSEASMGMRGKRVYIKMIYVQQEGNTCAYISDIRLSRRNMYDKWSKADV